jgi:hypothetical protein
MRQRGEAGGDGDGANFALSKTDRRALRQISRRGRAGATARQIGYRTMEAAGLATGLRLLRMGLVIVTPDNRFVLAKYADEFRANPFVADEHGRTGRIEHVRRMPLLQPKSKPAPVDVTGLTITKLPPGEAIGARDLRGWRGNRASVKR